MDDKLLANFKLRAGVEANPDQEGLDLLIGLVVEDITSILVEQEIALSNMGSFQRSDDVTRCRMIIEQRFGVVE